MSQFIDYVEVVLEKSKSLMLETRNSRTTESTLPNFRTVIYDDSLINEFGTE